jgi:hypothetical protein
VPCALAATNQKHKREKRDREKERERERERERKREKERERDTCVDKERAAEAVSIQPSRNRTNVVFQYALSLHHALLIVYFVILTTSVFTKF